MPDRGAELRAQQMAQLAKMAHEMATAPRIGELLEACESDPRFSEDPVSAAAVNIREIRRDYDRKTKLPAALVEEEAQLSSIGQVIWRDARKESSFKKFQPHLEKIVQLLRRKAKCYGWGRSGEPWDALADDYEPGCTAKDVEAVFSPLRGRLQALLDKILGSRKKPSAAFNKMRLPIEQQAKFVRFVAEQIGFDFQRGRMDTSTHPFCGGSHCNDVRITTRYRDDNMLDALGSVMHECGHGIYEQGLLEEHIGTPMGQSVSLGIHESQSRMWENQVGRSHAFWRWAHPKLKQFFGSTLRSFSFEDVYASANIVRPDFIRTEADEATYNMHIMVRFEIERALMNGSLSVGDIPGVWNAKYKEYLNLNVPDDRRGCLQDIHWSGASMGYFPTYTLGNLYAAQFFEKANADLAYLARGIEKGQFAPLKGWLNQHIHAHGRRHLPAVLCEKVTGKPLSAEPLMRHLEAKLRPIYGI